MASSVRVIVHTGEHGLEEAADYYADFPWEPSPAGELIMDKSQIVEVNNATLDLVLDEVAKVTAGDVVMLVCHAYGEGLLMPLAKGGRLPAGQTAIARLRRQCRTGTRLFWHFEALPSDPHSHVSTVRMWHIFAVTTEEIRPYWFRASAGTWKQTDKHRPDWSQARDFVNTYMMANAHYTSGPLRLAGFWTPDESVPWLLPMEPEYLEHIKQL
jgi:hypothetical protein